MKAGLDVVRAAELSPRDLQEDPLHIMETLGPVDNLSVLLIHASDRTPDENVRRIARTAFNFAEERGISLNDTSTCKPSRRSRE